MTAPPVKRPSGRNAGRSFFCLRANPPVKLKVKGVLIGGRLKDGEKVLFEDEEDRSVLKVAKGSSTMEREEDFLAWSDKSNVRSSGKDGTVLTNLLGVGRENEAGFGDLGAAVKVDDEAVANGMEAVEVIEGHRDLQRW